MQEKKINTKRHSSPRAVQSHHTRHKSRNAAGTEQQSVEPNIFAHGPTFFRANAAGGRRLSLIALIVLRPVRGPKVTRPRRLEYPPNLPLGCRAAQLSHPSTSSLHCRHRLHVLDSLVHCVLLLSYLPRRGPPITARRGPRSKDSQTSHPAAHHHHQSSPQPDDPDSEPLTTPASHHGQHISTHLRLAASSVLVCPRSCPSSATGAALGAWRAI